MEKLLPQQFLDELSRMYPGIWREADMWRSERGSAELPDWDQAVFLPMGGWYALTCLALKKPMLTSLEDVYLMQRLAVAGTWRVSQDIVRIDPDVKAALLDSDAGEKLPSQVFWRLPAWRVYFEHQVEIASVVYEGFFAMLEEDANDGHRELVLHFLAQDQSFAMPVHLGEWSLEESIRQMLEEASRNAGVEVPGIMPEKLRAAKEALGLVLHACSHGLTDREVKPGQAIERPAPRKTKKGWRLHPPDAPKIHELGKKFGERIRASRASHEGSHAGKRPHIRRAHWHGYWTGSRKEDVLRSFGLRFLPPIAVAMSEDDE